MSLPSEEMLSFAPVANRFSDVDPSDFADKLRELWTAAEQLGNAVTEQVRQETITPVQGIAIVSCITGQLFGYSEFHHELRPADLMSALSGSALRVGAGARQPV